MFMTWPVRRSIHLQLLKMIDTYFMFHYFLTSFKEIFQLFYC